MVLTLGRVDQLRVQVGYRAQPDGAAYEHFLLDLPLENGFGERIEEEILATLEPAIYAGSDVPRHYSIHQHRWHSSWVAASGVLDLGLLITAGRPGPTARRAAYDAVGQAFRGLIELAGKPAVAKLTRDSAVLRARRTVADVYGLDPDSLSVSTEQHDLAVDSWELSMRSYETGTYRVEVGFLDAYPTSVRVRHEDQLEVLDSVGTE